MFKAFAFLFKKPGIADARFHAHWRDPHGVMTAKIPDFACYAQNHGEGSDCAFRGLPAPGFRGVPAVWTRTLEDLANSAAHPDRPALDADGHHFYDVSRLFFLVCSEAGAIAPPGFSGGAAYGKAMLFFKGGTGDAGAMLRAVAEATTGVAALAIAERVDGANDATAAAFADHVLEAYFEPSDDDAIADRVRLIIAALAPARLVAAFRCREDIVFDRR